MYPSSMPLYELSLSRSCFICSGHLQKVLQKQAYSSLLSATLTALWAILSFLAKAIAVGKASTIQNALTASLEMPLLSLACLQGQLWDQSLCIVLRVAVSSTRVGLLFSLQMAVRLSHHENSVDGKSSRERGSAMAGRGRQESKWVPLALQDMCSVFLSNSFLPSLASIGFCTLML